MDPKDPYLFVFSGSDAFTFFSRERYLPTRKRDATLRIDRAACQLGRATSDARRPSTMQNGLVAIKV